MHLRPADIEDLDQLLRWQEQPHLLAASDDHWGWEHELHRSPDWREQLIAKVEELPGSRFVETRRLGDDERAVYRINRASWQARQGRS